MKFFQSNCRLNLPEFWRRLIDLGKYFQRNILAKNVGIVEPCFCEIRNLRKSHIFISRKSKKARIYILQISRKVRIYYPFDTDVPCLRNQNHRCFTSLKTVKIRLCSGKFQEFFFALFALSSGYGERLDAV